MAFNVNDHNGLDIELGNVSMNFSCWVQDYNTKKLQNRVSSVIVIETGSARIQVSLPREKTEELIEALHQHLNNIRAGEMALLEATTLEAA